MSEIISALIGALAALIGTFVAYVALKTAYRRSLDLESEWRKTLFNAAGSAEITMNQVQLLRTALRYDLVKDPEEYSFAWFTNIMILFCNTLNKKYFNTYLEDEDVVYHLTFQEQEVIRIFIRCVLKHNWEMNENIYFDFFGKPKPKKCDYVEISYNMAKQLCPELEYMQ